MKIIHFADETWDSGLTEYALTLACAQQRAGDRVWFAGLAGGYALDKAGSLGLQILPIRSKAMAFISLSAAARSIKPDIINAHTGSAQTAAAIAKISNPQVLTVRTWADARPFRLKALGGILWKGTDGFIAANTSILAEFRATYRDNKPAALIMQGILRAGRPVSMPPAGHTIGMVGRLDPVKGHQTAIMALALAKRDIPDIKLRIAGAEKNTRTADLKALAASLGIADSVTLEGFVPDTAAFMDGCAAGIIASNGSEAVSRAAMEWLSRGRGVIASRVGGLADIVKHGTTGLITVPSDENSLAEAMSAVFRDGRAEAFGKAGLKDYEDCFTPEIFERKTKNFYSELLRGQR